MRLGPCIYCRSNDGPFTSREHPMPEGIGAKKALPVGVVCDSCNHGHLAQADQVFLNFEPVKAMRVFQGIPTKAGALPHAEFSNVSIARVGPADLKVETNSRKTVQRQAGGFKLNVIGKRLTTGYLAQVTRFFHKAALGLMYIDHGRDFVLRSRFDEVRQIALGADFHGYLILPNRIGAPTPSVTFSYDFVLIDGEETVLTWMDLCGLPMATDLLVRKARGVEPKYRELFSLHRF